MQNNEDERRESNRKWMFYSSLWKRKIIIRCCEQGFKEFKILNYLFEI